MNRWNIEEAWRYEKAVYWKLYGYDNYGSFMVYAPVEIDVRDELYRLESVDPQGNVIAYDKVLVCDRLLPIGSIVALGTLEDWTAGTGTGYGELFQVNQMGNIPDIKGQYRRKVAYCMRYRDGLPEIYGREHDVSFDSAFS